ncbi:MAG: hypothetical protein WEB88_13930 [Gemmatimonadota bacterium]
MEIRGLASEEERRAAVALQEATWGAGFSQKVPESVLWFVPRVGGIAGGAFAAVGALVGFVFGVTGWVDGAPLHWSDMLAVRGDLRGAGIGLALKRWQRAELLAAGVTRAQWTVDPLVAANAHFNFDRLGCTAGTYLRDVYGSSDSPLHAGVGTDRLLVEWALDAPRVAALAAGEVAREPSLERGEEEIPLLDPAVPLAAPTVGIAAPADIQRLKTADAARAQAWHVRQRESFEWAFAAGYRVRGFRRRADGGGVYVLRATA